MAISQTCQSANCGRMVPDTPPSHLASVTLFHRANGTTEGVKQMRDLP